MAKDYKNNIFEVIKEIDKKNYQYYDSLDEEHKKDIQPYTLARWISSVDGKDYKQEWYNHSINNNVNMYYWDLSKYKDLQWKLLCSCGTSGWNKHKWIPLSKSLTNKEYNILRKFFNQLNDNEFDMKYSEMTSEEKQSIFEYLGILDK